MLDYPDYEMARVVIDFLHQLEGFSGLLTVSWIKTHHWNNQPTKEAS